MLMRRHARPIEAFSQLTCAGCEVCSGLCQSLTRHTNHNNRSHADMPVPTIYLRHEHRPDVERARVRELVDWLHAAASRATGEAAEQLAECAATLDSYQAGLILATPHPLTGWRIVPQIDPAVLDAYGQTEHTDGATDLNNALGAAA